MRTSLAALGFFPKTRLRHWPGLALYLMGWAAFKLGGFRLFRERTLRFKDFVVVADVEGRSGLAFLHEILVKRIYDLAPLRPDKPVQVIFDAGANCGFFALTRCAKDPRLKAHCFEPQPNTFARLQRNIAANGWNDRITAVPAAVAASSGACTLHVSAESSMGVVASSSVQCLESPTAVQVQMISLDDYAAQARVRPDLLKIDVEGFEVEVLKGAGSCLATAQYVILECHSEELTRQCQAILTGAGFRTALEGALLFAQPV